MFLCLGFTNIYMYYHVVGSETNQAGRSNVIPGLDHRMDHGWTGTQARPWMDGPWMDGPQARPWMDGPWMDGWTMD